MNFSFRPFFLTALVTTPVLASACATCRPEVMSRVYTGDFGQTLASLLLPIGLVLLATQLVSRVDRSRTKGSL